MNITLLTGVCSILFAIIFIASLRSSEDRGPAKVGDIYAHVNEGRETDPSKKDAPFVKIYRVEEISEGRAHISARYANMEDSMFGDEWEEASSVGRFDTLISRDGKAYPERK